MDWGGGSGFEVVSRPRSYCTRDLPRSRSGLGRIVGALAVEAGWVDGEETLRSGTSGNFSGAELPEEEEDAVDICVSGSDIIELHLHGRLHYLTLRPLRPGRSYVTARTCGLCMLG